MARRTGLIRSHLTQALEILETEKEIVPDTEIPASDASDVSEVSQTSPMNMLKSGVATQSPIPTKLTHSDFTQLSVCTRES